MFRKKPDPKGRVYDLFVVVMLKDKRSNITYIHLIKGTILRKFLSFCELLLHTHGLYISSHVIILTVMVSKVFRYNYDFDQSCQFG